MARLACTKPGAMPDVGPTWSPRRIASRTARPVGGTWTNSVGIVAVAMARSRSILPALRLVAVLSSNSDAAYRRDHLTCSAEGATLGLAARNRLKLRSRSRLLARGIHWPLQGASDHATSYPRSCLFSDPSSRGRSAARPAADDGRCRTGRRAGAGQDRLCDLPHRAGRRAVRYSGSLRGRAPG